MLKHISGFLVIAFMVHQSHGNLHKQCIFRDSFTCQEAKAPNCTCPCLPKCCPPQHVLSTRNPRLHGLSCQKANVNKLPQVRTVDNEERIYQADPNTRYFHSVFPSCEGVSDDQNDTSKWDYVVHFENLFVLQTKTLMEFILYTHREVLNSNNLTNNGELIYNNVSSRKTYTNFDNNAERKIDTSIPRKKPLMYFCFDLLDDPNLQPDEFQTVAITCPKKTLTKDPKITKCCPHGQVLDEKFENCVNASEGSHIEDDWRLQINGHLYGEGPLKEKEILVPYNTTDSSQNFMASFENQCKKEGKKIYHEPQTFHMGSDKIIHFTETHLKNKYTDFCVDMSMTYGHGSDLQYDYSAPNYDGLSNREKSSEYEYSYEDSDNSTAPNEYYYKFDPIEEYHDLNETGCFNSMGSSDESEHHMVAVFCDYEFIEVRKCCDKHQNLNLRARACIPSDEKQSKFLDSYEIRVHDKNGVELPGEKKKRTLHELTLQTMNNDQKNNLFVYDGDFTLLLDNGKNLLLCKGNAQDCTNNDSSQTNASLKPYKPADYCLDYTINYCSGTAIPILKAIINDENLKTDTASTIYGTNKEDSVESKTLKQVGYPMSIFFLVLTLLFFIIDEDLTKELHGKMVICIVGCLLFSYVSLFMSTFEPDSFYSVSKSGSFCIIKASVTYYFAISSFTWMSAMSYNVMTKFRGTDILPKYMEKKRFMVYGALTFGIPLIIMLAVVSFDRITYKQTQNAEKNMDGNGASVKSDIRYDPGFGEESCWFSSCSRSLSLFLYGPITVMMVANICMFVYSSFKLYNMQKNIQTTGPKTPYKYKRSSSKYSSAKSPSSEKEAVDRCLSRNMSRIDSGIGEGSVAFSKSESETDGNGQGEVLSDVCHSPNEDEVFTMNNKSKSFANTLSKIPRAKLTKQINRIGHHKDRLMTYLKLFLTMGLTWSFECIVWFTSTESSPAPNAIVSISNFLNILQPIAIFCVFAIKPSTRKKMNRKASRFRRSVMGDKTKKLSTASNNNKSSISDHTMMTDVGNRNSKRASRISMGMKAVKMSDSRYKNVKKTSFTSACDQTEFVSTAPTSPESPSSDPVNSQFAVVNPTNNRG